jgi:Glyoxalase-like domain
MRVLRSARGRIWRSSLPNPEQPELAVPRPYGVDGLGRGGLASWALACDDIDAAVARARSHGYDPGETADGHRAEPAGTVLRWRLTLNATVGGLIPFLISWGDTEHSARSASPG